MPASGVTGREGAQREEGEVQTLEAVSPWKAMVEGPWSEDQPSPHLRGQPCSAPQRGSSSGHTPGQSSLFPGGR